MVDVPAPEPAIAALRILIGSLENAEYRLRSALDRARQLDHLRAQGYTWRDILATEERPLLIELVGHTVEVLGETGNRFRRLEAKAMRAEGMKTAEIADIFGLPSERVEAMLAEPD